jgi:pimeloyl-ACP methyl ester carboxylesterase
MRSRYVTTNGIRLFCLEAGPVDGPLVLLLHGFPEIAYSWRHQLSALGEAGYRVAAPDLPGYGRSDKPDVTYDCDWINACLTGVADAYGADRFVIAGHDWGGLLVWIMARQYPARIAGVIGVNTPDLPRSPMPPVQLMFKVLETPIYIMQFQERGVAEWVLGTWGRGTDDFIELIFGMTTHSPDAFPPAVLDVYKDAFRPAGALTPPIEYYRNLDRNWELTTGIADRTIDVPCLMISAADDPVLTPAMTAGMEERVPNLERVVIENCGHWTQQERPLETNAAMLAYLNKLDRW